MESSETAQSFSGETPGGDDLPAYEPEIVARVAQSLKIRSVELLYSHFAAEDEYFRQTRKTLSFDVGVSPKWSLSDDRTLLSCILSFAILFTDEDLAPYEAAASFRLVYSIQAQRDLLEDEIQAFVWGDAVFTVWPYWREHVASLVAVAGFDSTPLSSLAIPRRAG